jgi:hypothetical protein
MLPIVNVGRQRVHDVRLQSSAQQVPDEGRLSGSGQSRDHQQVFDLGVEWDATRSSGQHLVLPSVAII